MRLRIAKPSDSASIAEIHYLSRDKLTKGFFSHVSKYFLYQYYNIVLNDPNTVVVCAEDSDGEIAGFASGTLDSEKQYANLRKYKFRLAIALIPSIATSPRLLYEAIFRYLSTQKKGEKKYVSIYGPRTEFWVWDARNKSTIWAGVLNNTHLHILLLLGVKKIRFEVDAQNQSVVKFSERNGAEFISRFILPDGRERFIMQYDLVKKFRRKPREN
ncbi:hypothetical protein C2742_01680 [Polynucleobacter paneuropaeus]|uniref:hypothetical protein n=1 Tax=Polynucleobacter paneuropaeus TaxID=2527775 RepID=UPI001BFD3ABC|nr:hypothetical protein [Polynucleobacter paneuropaeus]QWD48036.1 hypothetical protein G6658_01685 [Polynucleobacter paneuropaeus]QWD52912.1 hypothetical protein C2752_01680 [Polynucleobacter paneuropaeus]QWD57826.1 hypothetical protein C2742_01680 [Polynucleobacter paneuropaeus]